MCREILFRAKRLDDGEWAQGHYVNCLFPDSDVRTGHFIVEYPGKYYESYTEIYTETICQYTGLTDKSGRKIFEGDIVKTSQYGVDDGNGHNFAGFDMFSVDFSDGSFCLKNKWRRFNLRPQRDFEVIGNIYDNPELLEET